MIDAQILLARIDERTEFIQKHIEEINIRCKQHDIRIRKVEDRWNYIAGALGIIGLILTYIGIEIWQ